MRHVTHTFSRRVGALLLCLALLAGLLPTAAWAAEGDAGLPEQSTAQTSTEGGGVSDEDTTPGETRGENPGADDRGTDESPAGDGSKDNPYQISTAEDLLWFANLVNGTLKGKKADADAWAVLIEDIDLGAARETPGRPSVPIPKMPTPAPLTGRATPSAGCISTRVRTIRALWDIWARAASSKIWRWLALSPRPAAAATPATPAA